MSRKNEEKPLTSTIIPKPADLPEQECPQAPASLYQATAQALGNAAHNATQAQQQTNISAQAATTQGVALLYSLDTATTATGKILSSG